MCTYFPEAQEMGEGGCFSFLTGGESGSWTDIDRTRVFVWMGRWSGSIWGCGRDPLGRGLCQWVRICLVEFFEMMHVVDGRVAQGTFVCVVVIRNNLHKSSSYIIPLIVL